MTTILLYLLVQFNIGTSADTATTTGNDTMYVQESDGGTGEWEQGG